MPIAIPLFFLKPTFLKCLQLPLGMFCWLLMKLEVLEIDSVLVKVDSDSQESLCKILPNRRLAGTRDVSGSHVNCVNVNVTQLCYAVLIRQMSMHHALVESSPAQIRQPSRAILFQADAPLRLLSPS